MKKRTKKILQLSLDKLSLFGRNGTKKTDFSQQILVLKSLYLRTLIHNGVNF